MGIPNGVINGEGVARSAEAVVLDAGELLELIAEGRPSWMADALCREYPSVNFFPTQGEQFGEALAICRQCIVRDECESFAIEHKEEGIWGGTSKRERTERRRQRKAA